MSCQIGRIIQIKTAIVYSDIKLIDDKKNDITKSCLYSWSCDGICWTDWTSHDKYNFICQNLETDFYLRILIYSPFGGLYINNILCKCYNISINIENNFLKNFCEEPTLFQPYNNLDCALQLQTQLSDSIICMFGIPIYYIKVDPDRSTADYTFKEYSLHNVTSIKQIKLMIPDGQMPSSNPKLTEFDFEWETDWETELGKTQFATAFGDETFPKSGDLIYIPMMKRLWEVNSAYDEKSEGLMWRSTTWKLSLVKYNESTNVDQNKFDDLIDSWTTNTYEDVFGKSEDNEQRRETGAEPLSAPAFAASNLYNIFMEDSVRKQYTKQDVTILEKTYNHRSNIISRNIYKFKNPNGCITYQNPICGDSGTLMFIIETNGTLSGELERDIMNFGEIQIRMKYDQKAQNFHILFNDLNAILEPFKSYMVIIKWNRATFTTEMNIYNYTHREGVPVYKLAPTMYWFDYENPLYNLIGAYNNDYIMTTPKACQIHSYPLNMTNIKLYNKYLSNEEAIKESVKYTTKHESCIINDLARPILSGQGYAVK